jgi:hypothetical protein
MATTNIRNRLAKLEQVRQQQNDDDGLHLVVCSQFDDETRMALIESGEWVKAAKTALVIITQADRD